MLRLFLALILLLPAAARAAGQAPRYFITVLNGPYNFKGGEAQLEESFRALEGMVKLADAQGVRLTLLFSAQYALYVSSGPERLAGLRGWKKTGHEIGAYHVGPQSRSWDGYSGLPAQELSRLRKSPVAEGETPGHSEFFSALAALEPELRSGCMPDGADAAFRRAAPPYEVCGRDGGQADKGAGYSGVNEFVALRESPGAKGLSVFHPADRAGIAAAQKVFSGMKEGVYGTSFKSSPSEFGAFYAWLAFLRAADPLGVKSRTAAAVIEAGLLPAVKAARGSSGGKAKKAGAKPGKKAAAGKNPSKAESFVVAAPPVWPKEELPPPEKPRLKPVRSFFGSVSRMMFGRPRGSGPERASCGDGICDAFERAKPGRCPSDCGR